MSGRVPSASLAGLTIDPEALERLSPEEREQAAEHLRLVEDAFRENPLLGYRPHAKQQEFHRPAADGVWPALRAYLGGNRSGKTTGGMVDTIVQALPREKVPEHLLPYKRWEPPFKCRIMTPDFGDTHEVVLEKVREWCPKGELKGGSFDRAFDKQKKVLWFKCGSRFHFNSNIQEREQLGGSDLQRVLYDEEPRRDLRVESLTRLIDHDGEEIFTMTPLEGMSWLFDEVYEPWEKAQEDGAELEDIERELGLRITIADMDDNPHISPAGKARALAAYSGPEREARKSGRFVSFAGLIYPQFRSSVHTIPEAPVPSGAEVFCGIDPGLRNPAVVFCYLTVDDMLVVFDELLMPEHTIRQVCEQMRLLTDHWKVQPRWFVIDPAAKNRSNQTGRSDQQEFADNGIYTIPGQNAVGAGINRVRERLEKNRLMVGANCQGVRDEFKRYRYVKQKTRGEQDAKQAPVKKDDHLLDALRYVVMQRPLKPERDVRPETLTQKQRILRHHLRRLRRPAQADTGYGPGQFS